MRHSRLGKSVEVNHIAKLFNLVTVIAANLPGHQIIFQWVRYTAASQISGIKAVAYCPAIVCHSPSLNK